MKLVYFFNGENYVEKFNGQIKSIQMIVETVTYLTHPFHNNKSVLLQNTLIEIHNFLFEIFMLHFLLIKKIVLNVVYLI